MVQAQILQLQLFLLLVEVRAHRMVERHLELQLAS